MLSLLGFSRLRIGIMNFVTLLSLGFPQFPGWNPSFGFGSVRNFPTWKLFLSASPSLALPWRKSVNLNPYLRRPFIRVLPNCPKPLITPLKHEFPQRGFRPEIHVFGEKPSATHPAKILYQLLQFWFFLRDGGRHILQGNRDLLHLVLLSCFRHFAKYAQSLGLLRISSSRIPPANHYGTPTNQLLVIWKITAHHSFSRKCRSRKWLVGEEDSLKYPPSPSERVWLRNRSSVTVHNPL